MKKGLLSVIAWGLLTVSSSTAYAIAISVDSPFGGVLQDAVLFASANGEVPIDYRALGDIDLSTTDHVRADVDVSPTTTHWWLLGRQGDTFIYSSVMDMDGVDYLDVEPFNDFTLSLIDPIVLVQDINAGSLPALEIWIHLQTTHDSHLAADGATATLWGFSSPGSQFGSVSFSLQNNTPPGLSGGGQGQAPAPATLALMGLGLAGFGLRRFRRA